MVDAVAPGDGAQPRQVEVRVFDFQRIEGPFQQFKSMLHRVITLRQFQPPAQAVVAEFLPHRQHVRMQVGMAGPAARNGKGKAHQFAAIESADDLAPDFLADHEHAQRHQVHIVKLPDFFLQRDAGIEFVHAVTFSDGDRFGFCSDFCSDPGTVALKV